MKRNFHTHGPRLLEALRGFVGRGKPLQKPVEALEKKKRKESG